MHRFDIADLTRDYDDLVQDVLDKGSVVSPRGLMTVEVTDAVLVFRDAHSASFPVGIGRAVSKDLMAAELCQWAGGVSDLKQLRSASKDRFIKYSDDGTRLHGAYGPRAYSGLRRAVEVLMDDPTSRQAVVPLWGFDEPLVTNDLPCTVSWSFMIRDGKLNMTTLMRSNDVWTGVAYDIPIMARIQSAVAWALGVELGEYVHHAQSLHIYETDFEAAAGLHSYDGLAVDDLPFFDEIRDIGNVAWDARERWEWMVKNFICASRGGECGSMKFDYYAERLAKHETYDHWCPRCRYYLPQEELVCP